MLLRYDRSIRQCALRGGRCIQLCSQRLWVSPGRNPEPSCAVSGAASRQDVPISWNLRSFRDLRKRTRKKLQMRNISCKEVKDGNNGAQSNQLREDREVNIPYNSLQYISIYAHEDDEDDRDNLFSTLIVKMDEDPAAQLARKAGEQRVSTSGEGACSRARCRSAGPGLRVGSGLALHSGGPTIPSLRSF